MAVQDYNIGVVNSDILQGITFTQVNCEKKAYLCVIYQADR